MTINWTPSGPELGPVNLDTPLNITIDANESEPGNPQVVSISISADLSTPDQIFSNGKPASVTGVYKTDIFNHTANYIDCGESDKTVPSTLVTDNLIRNIPSNDKEIFKLTVDSSAQKIITITATANLNNASTVQTTFNLSVNNNFTSIGTWLQDYISNKPDCL